MHLFLAQHGNSSDDNAGEAPAADARRLLERLGQVFDEHGLSSFGKAAALRWVERMVKEGAADTDHVMRWLVCRINGLPGARPSARWQRGCPQLIPGLRAQALWAPDTFEWVPRLRAAFDDIRSELLALRADPASGFQPYRSPTWSAAARAADGVGGHAHDAGAWNVFYLQLHNVPFAANCERCPRTAALIQSIPRQYKHAFFSAMAPRTHITKHHGPTNKKLRFHLPLVVPPSGCRLRVGDRLHELREGECYVFDDSFEHEAWNDSDASRIVLIVDVWHPDLTDSEVKFLSFLQNSSLRAERRATAAQQDAPQAADAAPDWREDNLFSILEHTRQMCASPAELWAGVELGGDVAPVVDD